MTYIPLCKIKHNERGALTATDTNPARPASMIPIDLSPSYSTKSNYNAYGCVHAILIDENHFVLEEKLIFILR